MAKTNNRTKIRAALDAKVRESEQQLIICIQEFGTYAERIQASAALTKSEADQLVLRWKSYVENYELNKLALAKFLLEEQKRNQDD